MPYVKLPQYQRNSGQPDDATGIVILGLDGGLAAIGGKQETIDLIVANAVAPPQAAYGGDYVWTVTGTFNGASVQLQVLGPDKTTYQSLGPARTAPDAAGGTGIGLGSNAIVRVVVTGGPPTGLFASISRLPS